MSAASSGGSGGHGDQPRVVDAEPLTAEDQAWADKARDLQLQALPNIRAAAEKWAASLTGILGAVGLAALLGGPHQFANLEEPFGWIGKVVFFGAALLALCATKHAVQAAQEVTPRVFLPSGSALREASNTGVASAVRHLRCSRLLAAIGVTLVLVAAFVVWWGPKSAPNPTTIEVQGSALCRGGPATPARAKGSEGISYVVRCAPSP